MMEIKSFLKIAFVLVSLSLILGIAGCPAKEEIKPIGLGEELSEAEEIVAAEEETRIAPGAVSWRSAELKNVLTGEAFRISDFSDRPVLLESFAVWCPICLQQQKKIKELKDLEGDSVRHISLDTDPNEEEQQVIDHAKKNNFDWIFAVSPPEMTKLLINEFGIGVVNAPSAPVVLICPGKEQKARMLGRGVKSAEELKGEISKGC